MRMLWETQQYNAEFRAVDAEQSKSKRYIIPFALLCSLFFLWAVANNLNDILLPQFQQAFTLTNFQPGLFSQPFIRLFHHSNPRWDFDEKTQL
ncbi:L-fucose transporter [Salmonella enterica subsp. enterica]|uniref:L-fucose transporter n=1 Tax=Salmonella enterica I TaxID=59201 RepID=A0A379W3L5_SALET|nr:L-fucose transporter [Salmonella enterica subsp. enterica]